MLCVRRAVIAYSEGRAVANYLRQPFFKPLWCDKLEFIYVLPLPLGEVPQPYVGAERAPLSHGLRRASSLKGGAKERNDKFPFMTPQAQGQEEYYVCR